MTNKYHAREIVIDGIKFPSKVEGNRYMELKLLQFHGDISNLEVHPHFELFPETKIHGEKLKSIEYTADFRYLDLVNRVNVIEEVKAIMTRDAVLRINLFQRLHPEYVFRLIRTLKVKRRAKVRQKDIIRENNL